MAWHCNRAGSTHWNREMGMSRTIAVVSTLAVMALVAVPIALDREGRDSRPGADQATRAVYRGGWDGNGPDMSGAVGEGQATRVLYRGGWDGNGPDARGTWVSETSQLDFLVVQTIELPDGEVIGVAKD
jgi:hypothetical protein